MIKKLEGQFYGGIFSVEAPSSQCVVFKKTPQNKTKQKPNQTKQNKNKKQNPNQHKAMETQWECVIFNATELSIENNERTPTIGSSQT